MAEYTMMLKKVISGGQTGVDTAALLAAKEAGLDTGGWVPPGCKNEEGSVPEGFGLKATPEDKSAYAPEVPRSLRTEWNVRDANGTLIICMGQYRKQGNEGTVFTKEMAKRYEKPYLVIDLKEKGASDLAKNWLVSEGMEVLNIAGPSEKTEPGIQQAAFDFLSELLNGQAT